MLKKNGASFFFLVRNLASNSLPQGEYHSIEPGFLNQQNLEKNPNSFSNFIRFIWRKEENRGELQTSIITYTNKSSPFLQVDLVSTIHFADREYFATLQKELKQYDRVLYEMVAIKDTLPSLKNPSSSQKLEHSFPWEAFLMRSIQFLLNPVLQLDSQRNCIDYEGDNWYNADLDYATFKLLQREKGEGFGDGFFTFVRDIVLGYRKSTGQPTSMSSIPEVSTLFRLGFHAVMKVFLAKMLTFSLQMSGDMENSVIIGERNRVVMDALKKAIEDGSQRIAILYGAGHMPDMGMRLCKEFDLVPLRGQWITAWLIKNHEL